MKLLASIFVFVMAFSAGTIAPSLFFRHTGQTPLNDGPRYHLFDPPAPLDGIHVFYAGVGHEGPQESFIRLVIYNGTDKWLHYDAQYPTQILAEISVDGRKLETVASCGVDMEIFHIPPRMSSEARIFSNTFSRPPIKGEKIVLSLPLLPAGEEITRNFSTEPFVLPEEFRKSILSQRN